MQQLRNSDVIIISLYYPLSLSFLCDHIMLCWYAMIEISIIACGLFFVLQYSLKIFTHVFKVHLFIFSLFIYSLFI